MNRVLLLLACAAFMQSGFSQTAQTDAEKRGRKLIDQAVEALGGQNFLKMEDRTETGRAYSFYREEISGLSIATIYTRYITVAQGMTGQQIGQRERQSFGTKGEDSAVLFNEKGGWEITYRGAKEFPQDRIDRYRDTTLRNILYILRQRLNEPGMIYESRGSDVFENQPVDVVDVTDAQDRVITVFLHQSTHLPVREAYRRFNPETKERDQEVVLFSRYRDAGGVQWPHQMRRERNGEKVYEIFSESVHVNSDLTDDMFILPADGSALLGKKKK
jgi:hypothetical protein